MMKQFFLICFILSQTIILIAQNTVQFSESERLKYDKDSNRYVTNKFKGKRLYLEIKKYLPSKSKFNLTGKDINNNGETTKIYEEEKGYKYSVFTVEDSINKKYLYGVFVQKEEEIHFYPWGINKKRKKFKEIIDFLNHDTLKETELVIRIPSMGLVKTSYASNQYGILTLPVKTYIGDSDTITNTQFDVNINLMIGRRWGKKKYQNLPETDRDPYITAFSINALLGIGKLTLSSENTRGDISREIDVAVLGAGFAFGIQHKELGVFIALGIDQPLSIYGENWIFNKKLWIGFGLGLGF